MNLKDHPEGCTIDLHVTAKARKTGFCGLYGDRIKLKVKAPPDKGRANEEVRRFLSSHFALPLRDVIITKGEHSRLKTVLLRNLEPKEAF